MAQEIRTSPMATKEKMKREQEASSLREKIDAMEQSNESMC